MTEKLELYRCEICGNMVEVVISGVGELVCCGKPMKKLTPKNDEVEKERLRKIYNINEQIFQKKINEYKNNDWLNRDRKNLNYVIEEKSLIIKDDNSIWSKIKNFFKRILKK